MTKDLQLNINDLCLEIEREHKAAQDHYNKACDHALRAGQYLCEAKSRARTGDWLGFIDRNFTFSARTTQLYMRVARNPQRVAHLSSLREAQRALAKPKPVEATDDQAPRTRQEWAGKINRSWQDATESASALGENIEAAKEDLEHEVLLPETDSAAAVGSTDTKSTKPRKPTRAQLEKRKERLERAMGDLLMSSIESIDRGFFSPTGDHLHPDDFYPAVDAYLDAATADRLVAELTEARATIDQWIDRLKVVKLATKEIVSEAETTAAVDDAPLVIPAVFRREKSA